jgi:hypothetical protein
LLYSLDFNWAKASLLVKCIWLSMHSEHTTPISSVDYWHIYMLKPSHRNSSTGTSFQPESGSTNYRKAYRSGVRK